VLATSNPAGAVCSMRAGESHTVPLEGLTEKARDLWRELPSGSVVWLTGELGSGKTAFVQALADAAGADRASSPTFSLVQEYGCRSGVIYHVDCYRMKRTDEALDLDFPGILGSAHLLLIEWPERAGHHAPAPDVSLAFYHVGDPDMRRIERVS
jgi:tRNA threonylcarbamoyladenosine biosynthesis protein TsaE